MDELLKSLPLAVYVAILIFILREILDSIKKRAAVKRKRGAFKLLLAQELEINNYAFRAIFETIKDLNEIVNSSLPELSKVTFHLNARENGVIEYQKKYSPTDSIHSGWPIPVVKRDLYNRLLPEIAEIDKKLFNLVTETYTEIGELEHLRNGILEYTMEADKKMFLSGFPEYGLAMKNDIFSAMDKLYQYCSNSRLEKIKTR